MSILAEILATAGQVEMLDLNTKISKLTEQITSLKLEVMDIMDNTYVKFIPYFKEDQMLFRRATDLSMKLDDLQERVESQIKRELADSTGELDVLKDKLKESDLSINLANKLLSLHMTIADANKDQESQSYFGAAMKLKEYEEMLNEKETDLSGLEVYNALREELYRTQGDFSFTTLEQWKPCLKWHEVITDFVDSKQISLHVQDGTLKTDLIQALDHYNLLVIEVQKFGDKFLNNILIPVISKTSAVVIESNGRENEVVLLVDIKSSKHLSCIEVINNLILVFEFLFSVLNVPLSDSTSFITELGECIGQEFCDYFIYNCLDKAVPKRQEELNSYDDVIKKLSEFEKLLHEGGFLPESNRRLLEYTEDIDVLIVNKICESYLETARELMKKDLHDMMEEGVRYKILDYNDSDARKMRLVRQIKSIQQPDSDQSMLVSELSPNTFQFPVCQISKSSFELMQLNKSLLEETSKINSRNCAFKMFITSRNIFKMYCEIVPLYHNKMIETIPQQAALLRNNCYYLAHELMILGNGVEWKRPDILKNDILTYVDLVDSLQAIGNDALYKQREIQAKQILDILRDSGLVTLIENPEFPEGVEKAVRQCNRQLVLLQKVWQPVLPTDAYCKILGSLCTTFVQELIDRVCSTGDIPADTASELVRVFSIVQEKTPSIFPEPKEIHQYVVKWTKFNELVKLLGANLRDVDERWSDGKGPLAQEFSADQVKQLVKALFQISDRRANLLARIK